MESNGQEKLLHSAIASEIEVMVKEDQEMREKSLSDPKMWNSEIDKKNTARMKEIIAQIGWPTASKVAEKSAHNAWLLVQHADHDIEFQKQCLELMEREAENEVRMRDIAYLTDRIRTNENKPQLYGTQFEEIDGKFVPQQIEDKENVDDRRKSAGLGSLEEGIREMAEKYAG